MEPTIASRREFLSVAGLLAASVASGHGTDGHHGPEAIGTPFSQAPLPYAFNALEPVIDRATMELHYQRHHAGYVRNFLNAYGEQRRPEDVEAVITTFDASTSVALRNNGGGHVNHHHFWLTMQAPGGARLGDVLAFERVIRRRFGGVDAFMAEFKAAALRVFGSGWAWLCLDDARNLFITTTPNQDNPLMTALVDRPGTPLLGLDVWEHAYYLNYQNRRAAYVDAWWKVVNWAQVSRNWEAALARG